LCGHLKIGGGRGPSTYTEIARQLNRLILDPARRLADNLT
jgi:hypothetical protein